MAVAADNVADSEPDDFEAVVAGEFHIVDNVAAPGCFEGSVAVAVEVAFDAAEVDIDLAALAADADIHTADAIPALVAEFHALLADNVVEVELVDADSVDAAAVDAAADAAAEVEAEVEAGTPVKSVGEARNSFVAG